MTGFLNALAEQSRNERIIDGIKDLVVAYYVEYTDATEIDDEARMTLRNIETLLSEITVNLTDMDEIVQTAEAEVQRDYGRTVRTVEFYTQVDD